MNRKGEPIWDFTRDDISWEGGQLCFDLWHEKKPEHGLPARQQFHPKELMATLPTVMLIDMAEEDRELSTIRLVGTDIVTMMGRDPTGMKVADLRGGQALLSRFAQAADRAVPYLAIDLLTPFESHKFPTYSVLVMPLSSHGGEVDMLMMNLHFNEKVGHVFKQP